MMESSLNNYSQDYNNDKKYIGQKNVINEKLKKCRKNIGLLTINILTAK